MLKFLKWTSKLTKKSWKSCSFDYAQDKVDGKDGQNPKFEARNSKQIENANVQILKTENLATEITEFTEVFSQLCVQRHNSS